MTSPESDPQYADDCTITRERSRQHGLALVTQGECPRCGETLPDWLTEPKDEDR